MASSFSATHTTDKVLQITSEAFMVLSDASMLVPPSLDGNPMFPHDDPAHGTMPYHDPALGTMIRGCGSSRSHSMLV